MWSMESELECKGEHERRGNNVWKGKENIDEYAHSNTFSHLSNIESAKVASNHILIRQKK
jgi:hypothetical protein